MSAATAAATGADAAGSLQATVLQREAYAADVLVQLEHDLDTMLFDAMPAILSTDHLQEHTALGDSVRTMLRGRAIEELTAHEAQLDQVHAALMLEADDQPLVAEAVTALTYASTATAYSIDHHHHHHHHHQQQQKKQKQRQQQQRMPEP
eukprot:COSAG02_NODE_22224_length_759_cov_1.101515_1_plen_149_part_10